MKKFNIYIKILATIILILFMYLLFIDREKKENFVPKIVKETYQPIKRKVRMTYEGFYNRTYTNVNNIFRKLGIL